MASFWDDRGFFFSDKTAGLKWWVIGLGVLIVYTGKDIMKPRGIRNNNPGNIRLSREKWLGLSDAQTDPEFFVFERPFWGIRAMTKIIVTYRDKYGINTIAGIINRWAPQSENDTESYIRSVESMTGIPRYKSLVLNDEERFKIVSAIIHHENGQNPYYLDDVANAVRSVPA